MDGTHTIGEVLLRVLNERDTGVAEYRPDTNVILMRIGPNKIIYEIDLDRCATAEQALDWIFHLAGKRWCQGEMLQDFVRCLKTACMLRHGRSARDYFGVKFKLSSRALKKTKKTT